MKRMLFILPVLLVLTGCVSVAKMEKVEAGQQSVGSRLSVTLDSGWNHFTPAQPGPAKMWTMEGLPVDVLSIYAGIKDGEAIDAVTPQGMTKIQFRAGMQPDEIVGMFEGLLTRGGSTFKLEKLEPWTFDGEKGFRFEFTFTRKVDGVVNNGLGYGTVSKGELFTMLYVAPRLGFFPRHKDKVEQIARGAKLKI